MLCQPLLPCRLCTAAALPGLQGGYGVEQRQGDILTHSLYQDAANKSGGGEVSLFLLPSSPAPAVPSHAVWKTLERAYPGMDNRLFNTQVS